MSCNKLIAFRKLLLKNEIQAYIFRTTDSHNSEFTAIPDKRIGYLSGFTGSNGTIVVTEKQALLWTDGRYFDQALSQLSSEWTLMKDRTPGVLSVEKWLASKMTPTYRIGYDARLMTIDEHEVMIKAGVQLYAINDNLVDLIWKADESNPKPEYGNNPVFVWNIINAGQSAKEKLSIIQQNLTDDEMIIFSALDEIAWLFNLRGSDVLYNPVFFAFAMVNPKCCHLYTKKSRLSTDVISHLASASVQVEEYEQFWKDLEDIPSEKVLTAKYTSVAVKNQLGSQCVVTDFTPVAKLKAKKNETEQKGMKFAHIKDAVAVCEFLYQISKNPESFDEISAETLIDNLRKAQSNFISQSFRTISAYGSNGAVIHYNASKSTNKTLGKDNLYLVDSGGQYLQGTTDITRTVHFGTPTKEHKKCFTAVLKGHIALASSRFPSNAAASRLDTIARKCLWDMGLDYGHGTGHGVGCFLNVHEGPFSISTRILNEETLCEGAVVSDEPGYYESGKFGIRIESLLLCKKDEHPNFLCFEPLTLVPISRNLIDINMLNSQEIEYLNKYHHNVNKTIIPEMIKQGKSDTLIKWIENATTQISKN